MRGSDVARTLRRGAAILAVAAVAWVAPYSVLGSANLAASYALVAVSLVLLTGWVGQISLGHAALVGAGAYVTGWIAGGSGIPFPLSLPLAAAASGTIAALLGVVALRVRGLYLAVATLVFSWMASEFLFHQTWFVKHDQIPDRVIGGSGWMLSFDFTDRRVFFLVAWAAVAMTVYGATNVRDSKTGRAFFAVRGSEMAAASLGIDVMRTKLVAFAVSGAIAGAAGNLFMSDARVVTADQFTFNVSLFYLSMSVVGGLTSLSGALASAILFAGLTEVFFRVRVLGGFLEIVSGALLALSLLVYRGGLAAIGARVAEAARGRLRALGRPRAAEAGTAVRKAEGSDSLAAASQAAGSTDVLSDQPYAGNGHEEAAPLRLASSRKIGVPAGAREDRPALIEAENVTVRFGGLVAVKDASLRVHEGEIVGLIGPNGAGKTTLFNAIAGFNVPAAGTIKLYGTNVTRFPVHRRAAIGMARTFQQIQLFGQLSVYENLLVATHAQNTTGLVSHLLVSDRSIAAEREARRKVREVLGLLELQPVADRRVADLPFGVLRMVEVARALVTGYRVTMLDEPASGLDNAETDRLMEILRFVRDLGVTLLLIEHDVRMVTSVSDHMYVLEQGRIIADGPPESIQRDPGVIAAYLGEPTREAVG